MPEAAGQAIGLIGGRWASFVCGTTGLLTPRLPADRRVYPAPNAFATAPVMAVGRRSDAAAETGMDWPAVHVRGSPWPSGAGGR